MRPVLPEGVLHMAYNMAHNKLQPEEIFNNFYRRIYSFTLMRVCNVHEAEDLTSNVFVKVVEKLDTYNPSIAAFSTWIFTIALNEIRMFYRRNKFLCSLDDINETANQMDIEDSLLLYEERSMLLKAVEELDKRRKNIILLKYFDEMTDRQIADVMNLSEKNIGVILTRTRKDLKNKLLWRVAPKAC